MGKIELDTLLLVIAVSVALTPLVMLLNVGCLIALVMAVWRQQGQSVHVDNWIVDRQDAEEACDHDEIDFGSN